MPLTPPADVETQLHEEAATGMRPMPRFPDTCKHESYGTCRWCMQSNADAIGEWCLEKKVRGWIRDELARRAKGDE